MSALPLKADICQRIEHVCFVPLTDIYPLIAGEIVHHKIVAIGRSYVVVQSKSFR